jgi:hypothetical protein
LEFDVWRLGVAVVLTTLQAASSAMRTSLDAITEVERPMVESPDGEDELVARVAV